MLGSVRRRKFEEQIEIPGIFRKAKTKQNKKLSYNQRKSSKARGYHVSDRL